MASNSSMVSAGNFTFWNISLYSECPFCSRVLFIAFNSDKTSVNIFVIMFCFRKHWTEKCLSSSTNFNSTVPKNRWLWINCWINQFILFKSKYRGEGWERREWRKREGERGGNQRYREGTIDINRVRGRDRKRERTVHYFFFVLKTWNMHLDFQHMFRKTYRHFNLRYSPSETLVSGESSLKHGWLILFELTSEMIKIILYLLFTILISVFMNSVQM